MRPSGAFDLASGARLRGRLRAGHGRHRPSEPDTDALLVVFPVEGWASSAAVELRQEPDGAIVGPGHRAPMTWRAPRRQALRCLSLDHDGSGWPEVGRRDPVIGALQERYGSLRPVCFLSAWEAATSFVIGQRISMRQGASGEALAGGDGGRCHRAPGRPDRACVPAPRRAAGAGGGARASPPRRCAASTAWRRRPWTARLDTETLRALPEAEALARLRGSCPASDPGPRARVLMRGCGTPDTLPLGDGISRERRGVPRMASAGDGDRRPRGWTSRRPGGPTGCGRRCCSTWPGAGSRRRPPSYRQGRPA